MAHYNLLTKDNSLLNEILKKITSEYSHLSKETIEEWKKDIQVLQLKKGTQLVSEHKYTNRLFYIYKGSAKAYHLKDGKAITDWFSFNNEFICAITGYFLGQPSEHCIELTEDSVLLEFKREDINMLSDKYFDFERFTKNAITKIMLQLQQRVTYLQFSSARERYAFLLQQYPEIELHISLGDIASYIGITQETLSRVRAKK
ncbi:Crp/Fnr family transcriptional regulator [Aquimarina sediminis]|uniref:Crp/Fnr family transcriptional regulator n=1 Tax=Aquimarina sediminis TaxID=2070536 RepID=UPI000CA057BB|nr:Crp/Fnr family transcriptional regulator [Aquimarina sediminis]